jgi:predicted RNA-binding Zn ribbon-like protein
MIEPAELLRDFVNTFHVGEGVDDLNTPAALSAWLAERGLISAGAPAGPGELAMATTLREGLRAAMLEHQGIATRRPPPELDGVLAGLPLRVALTPAAAPALLPTTDGVAAGLGALVAAIMATVADGTWARLKACQEDSCHSAFIDTSKNRSRSWCSMRVCGNRTKTRTYRARRRGVADDHL